MLAINTRNDKLAAARADFASRGMLHGTCLGEAIQALCHELGADEFGDPDDEGESGGPDGNGEPGSDLDLEQNDEDDGAPGPADGPEVFSEVTLAYKKGNPALASLH